MYFEERRQQCCTDADKHLTKKRRDSRLQISQADVVNNCIQLLTSMCVIKAREDTECKF